MNTNKLSQRARQVRILILYTPLTTAELTLEIFGRDDATTRRAVRDLLTELRAAGDVIATDGRGGFRLITDSPEGHAVWRDYYRREKAKAIETLRRLRQQHKRVMAMGTEPMDGVK